MKLIFALLLVPAIATADVNIVDNDETWDIDCAKDGNVSILGNNATVTLTGTCSSVAIAGNEITLTGSAKKVVVAGNENRVTLDAVDALAVYGNENTVSYKRALSAKKPKVTNAGHKNDVARR